MNGPQTLASAPVHPLLFDACHCQRGPFVLCMTCARWARHYRTMAERRKTWGHRNAK